MKADAMLLTRKRVSVKVHNGRISVFGPCRSALLVTSRAAGGRRLDAEMVSDYNSVTKL